MVAGTKAETVIAIIEKIPLKQRNLVNEITLDMAGNTGLIAKRGFPKATQVTDRFQVQKLASEALQEIRFKHRWEDIDHENEAIEKTKKNKKRFEPELLTNGDTVKQLLARSRYFYTRINPNGQIINYNEQTYCSNYIPISKRLTIFLKDYEISLKTQLIK